jgi:quinoprotein glucose dehydrogenase
MAGQKNRSRLVFAFIAAGLICAVTAGVVNAARNTKWWVDNLSGPDSSNFVGSDQITKANVNQLQVAWHYPYARAGFNPIVVDDVMYTAARNGLVALDATTGKELWIHEDLGQLGRGINFWQSEDGRDKRLLFWINGFLQAIDARTGKSITSFGIDGSVNLRDGILRVEGTGGGGVTSASPGKVWKDSIILGSATGEGWISPPGDIRAFDVRTGKKLWQFHVVPQPGEFGYETNPPDGWKYMGGSNNWGSMSVDEERGIVYIPTGSATYDFYGADRHGQNLYANCILALDARTGKRLWHFQTIHHDLWDLDNVSAPLLVTVTQNGRRVDAVAHAGKTGFMYVFNRVTGEPLWPIEERPVPASDVPGELAWPTQPFPTKPPPFNRQSFTIDDVNPWRLTPEAYKTMQDRMKVARNGTGPQGGLFIPLAVNEDSVSMPGNQGGSNWGTTAANPAKGTAYVIGVNQVALLKLVDVTTGRAGGARGGGGGGGGLPNNIATGAAVYAAQCQACHGADRTGAMPGVPSLVGVGARMAEDAMTALITNGRGLMRAFPDLGVGDREAVIAFVMTDGGRGRPGGPGAAGPGGGGRGGRGGGGAPFPPSPAELVAGRGGAPLPTLPPRGTPTPFDPEGRTGPTGGNTAYPADVTAPRVRYASGYNVLGTSTKPPYTTLTAYDLNNGTIKWQVGNGDDPQTVACGGPTGTGSVGGRNGIVVVQGGVVFHGGGDGTFRAYDEDTGRELWKYTLPGSTSGVPAGYESKGKQYVVVLAGGGPPPAPAGGAGAGAGAAGAPGAGGGGGGGRGGGGQGGAPNCAAISLGLAGPIPAAGAGRGGQQITENTPRGVIAFALPGNAAPAKK